MLIHDPFPAFEFLKLGQLGQMFAISATAVGTKLKQLGLRLPNGDPTGQARNSGITKLVQVEGMNPFWVWHKVKTVTLLEAAGLRRPVEASGSNVTRPELVASAGQPSTTSPVARLEVEPSGLIEGVAQQRRTLIVARTPAKEHFEIVWPDGQVRAWVKGDVLADQVAKVLTLALQAGRLQ